MSESTGTLRAVPDNPAENRLRAEAVALMQAALNAVDPRKAIRNVLTLRGDMLHVGDGEYPLVRRDRLVVVGAGKAGATMAQAVEEILGDRIDAGLVITKRGQALGIFWQAHPDRGGRTPDARRGGTARSAQIAEMLEPLGRRALVICLVSGGGSALLTLPASGIELSNLQDMPNNS